MPPLTSKSDKFIRALADELEVPEERYAQAERSYKSFGEWTHRDDSTVVQYSPEVYVQGSFRLGTAIQPSTEDGEYDIDLVCVLQALSKGGLTQKDLRELLEAEVRSYHRAKGMKKPVSSGRRCWTLKYADGAQFHMDILPAIPNAEGQRRLLEERRMDASFAATAISITDNEHEAFSIISDDWPRSNPKGYAQWFKSRMGEAFDRIRRELAEAQTREGVKASVEDIPEYRVRTPLQQAIMLLKRHRDDMFTDDPETKPISIIISTLSAHAYNGEVDTPEALLGILGRMESHIKYDGLRYIIPNPTDATENFADRWENYPERGKAFFSWLAQARKDFFGLGSLTSYEKMSESKDIYLSADLRRRALDRVMKGGGVSLLGAATAAPATAASDYSFSNEPRKPKAPRDFA